MARADATPDDFRAESTPPVSSGESPVDVSAAAPAPPLEPADEAEPQSAAAPETPAASDETPAPAAAAAAPARTPCESAGRRVGVLGGLAARRMAVRRRAGAVPFDQLCVAAGLPAPVPEYAFAQHVGRAWRFDWAWPDYQVALEIDGGIWTAGRHIRPQGFLEDMVKLNAAVAEGWSVVRCVPAARGRSQPSPLDVASGETLETLRCLLVRKRGETYGR